jgi:hypothetical protein
MELRHMAHDLVGLSSKGKHLEECSTSRGGPPYLCAIFGKMWRHPMKAS